jgi:hypothetical protein
MNITSIAFGFFFFFGGRSGALGPGTGREGPARGGGANTGARGGGASSTVMGEDDRTDSVAGLEALDRPASLAAVRTASGATSGS